MTKVYDFKKAVNEKDLFEIKNIILNEGIIVFPTETVYGIGASIYSDIAINKIFQAKGRPNDNPLIVHISNLESLSELAIEIDEVSQKLIDSFWPGPLTIILPKTSNVSDLITGGLNTVGVRFPESTTALKIIDACGVPIAAPSANISGKPSGTNIEDIFSELESKVDAIIDGGNAKIGLESTVVRVKDGIVHILRPGKVTKEDILNLGLIVANNNHDKKTKDNEKVLSPGTKYKHYAPNAKTILVYSKDNKKMISKINELINNKEKTIIICSEENKSHYIAQTLVMGYKDNLDEISKNIFAVLRNADRMNPDLIIIEGVISKHFGTAIMNRLMKACSYNYILID